MGAAFYDLTMVQNTYLVGIFDGGETMGNDQGGTVFHQMEHGILYQFLRLGIQ